MRVGIIGGGFMGAVHTAAARAAGAEVAVIAASSRMSASRAAARLGIESAADSVADLLDRDLDVVHVCSPNGLHREHALAVIASGRAVICEKPLATSMQDAVLLRDAAQRADVVAVVPFVYRFHPMVREARARVRGRLFTIQGSYLQDWLLEPSDRDWRDDAAAGGPSRAFADIGSHLVDLIEFVGRDPITRLQAAVRTVHESRRGQASAGEDAVALVIETATGAVGSLLISQVAAGRKNALVIELATESTSVRFEQEAPDSLWIGGRAASATVTRDAALLVPDAARLSTLPAGHPMGYLDAFANLARDTYAAIRGEAPEGLPTFADGVRAAQLTEAVLQSARRGGWTSVDTTAPHPTTGRGPLVEA